MTEPYNPHRICTLCSLDDNTRKRASFAVFDEDGNGSYACKAHANGYTRAVELSEWFATIERQALADDAVERLRSLSEPTMIMVAGKLVEVKTVEAVPANVLRIIMEDK